MCDSIGCLEVTRHSPPRCSSGRTETLHRNDLDLGEGGQRCSISSLVRRSVCNTTRNEICQDKVILKIFTSSKMERKYRNHPMYLICYMIYIDSYYIFML